MGVMCFGVWAITECWQLEAVIVMSSSSMALGKERRAGYDGYRLVNDVLHSLNIVLSTAPHRHMVGYYVLCIARVQASYPALMYCWALLRVKPT